MELVNYSHPFLPVTPAASALLLVVVIRRVLSSLGIGIILGAVLLADGSPSSILLHSKDMAARLAWTEGGWPSSKSKILTLLLLLGVFISLLTYSGSSQASAGWAKHHIKGRCGVKMLAAGLVFVTFIDDYFYNFTVGAIVRPVTDKFKVSYAKLAHIPDSTAAPMCVLIPVSSWGTSIIAALAGLLVTHKVIGYTPTGTFVTMSLMNYYALFALIMVFAVAWSSFDIDSVARLERAVQHESYDEAQIPDNVRGWVYTLIISTLVLIFTTVSVMLYTGDHSLEAFNILGVSENTDVNTPLVADGLSGVTAVLLTTVGATRPSDYGTVVWQGIKSMFGAIIILTLTWLISTVVSEICTGEYPSTLVTGSINSDFLPVVLFLLASMMVFVTGTSWDTFGIMPLIATAMTVKIDTTLVTPCMSAVTTGAMCGDYYSPIPDTMILSFTGTCCSHTGHVTSQLSYALTVAAAVGASYLALGFVKSALSGFAVAGVVLAVLTLTLKNKNTAQKP